MRKKKIRKNYKKPLHNWCRLYCRRVPTAVSGWDGNKGVQVATDHFPKSPQALQSDTNNLQFLLIAFWQSSIFVFLRSCEGLLLFLSFVATVISYLLVFELVF